MKSLLKSKTYKVCRASKLVKYGHMSNICQTFETTEFHKFSDKYYTFEELQNKHRRNTIRVVNISKKTTYQTN
jgi:hypothetical protein